MDPRTQLIWDSASGTQQDYIIARLTERDQASAARRIGIHKSTVTKWPNLAEIEEVVTVLRRAAVEAGQLALEALVTEAVQALGEALKDKRQRVQAAKTILDRAGLPAMSNVDVTSGGEPIRATVYIPDNGRDDRD